MESARLRSDSAERLAERGQLRAAAAAFRACLDAPDAPAAAHLGLGNILYEWNDLAGARTHWQRAAVRAELEAAPGAAAMAWLQLARLSLVDGHASAAAAHEGRARQAAAARRGVPLNAPTPGGYLEALHLRLALDRGGPEAAAGAERWLSAHGHVDGADRNGSPAGQTIALVHGRALLSARGPTTAETFLNQLIAQLDVDAHRPALIEAHAVLALARQARGDDPGGLLALVQALMLGELEGYVRTFLDQGPDLRRLLAEVRGDWQPYAERLLGGQVSPSALPNGSASRLTPREVEVLRLAAAGQANGEIATTLGLGLGTVKQHLSRAFRKLGVHRRADAARRARALGLLA